MLETGTAAAIAAAVFVDLRVFSLLRFDLFILHYNLH
jgi:hypothetical protein